MLTAEQIKQANKECKPIQIKKGGKSSKYNKVAEKVKAFRKILPDGNITTQIIEINDDRAVFRAEVRTVEGWLLGTGTACIEKMDKPNDFIECAETKAVGRALAFCGLGLIDDIASAEDITDESANDLIDLIKADALIERCKNDGVDIAELCKLCKVKSIEDLNNRKYAQILYHWDKIALKSKGTKKEAVITQSINGLPFEEVVQ